MIKDFEQDSSIKFFEERLEAGFLIKFNLSD